MSKKALVIIAQMGYQDIELAGTRKGLEEAGFEITLASTAHGECIGKYDGRETADLALSEVDVSAFDRVAFIGGPGAKALREEPEALRIARETAIAKKPLGAICIAPTILAAAGVLEGKTATVTGDGDGMEGQYLEEHGAMYTGEDVTIDGLIVTGNGPKAAVAFGKKFAQL